MTNGGMFVEERKQRILERIERRRKATVAELCEQFHVSSATIRTDLRDLEAAGLLIRTHGGAKELARLLGRRRDLTVVTNDLAIALVLEAAESVRTLFICGLVRRNYHCTMVHGAAGRDILAGLGVDKAFMTCNSFSVVKGASAPDINQAETKKLMMSIAARVLLLFDATKMGRTSFALFAPLETIDTIVTDAIGSDDRARLEENGVDVIVAG